MACGNFFLPQLFQNFRAAGALIADNGTSRAPFQFFD